MKRSEERVVAQIGKKVVLGGKEYEIKPLPMMKSIAWREKFAPKLSEVMASHASKALTPSDFMVAFSGSSELACDALFGYAPELPEKAIMEVATEQEIIAAFATVMGFAFGPFLGMVAYMGGFQKRLEEALASGSQSEPSSKLP